MDTISDNTSAGEPTLVERVRQFERLELPGQPVMMHMGTSYLITDLWREIERLRAVIERTAFCLDACDAKTAAEQARKELERK